ncbi:MAG: hypothetical protein HY669_04675 [Chloroflexi bacterium]|nr:hypothetical protein [Chloroflexota bacterium]
MPSSNATPSTSSGQAIESRRFGVEIEVESISTKRARRELRLLGAALSPLVASLT